MDTTNKEAIEACERGEASPEQQRITAHLFREAYFFEGKNAERLHGEMVQCHCDGGRWSAECCNGARGCSCQGRPVDMGTCQICDGSGWHTRDADMNANLRKIQGLPYLGSGPQK